MVKFMDVVGQYYALLGLTQSLAVFSQSKGTFTIRAVVIITAHARDIPNSLFHLEGAQVLKNLVEWIGLVSQMESVDN